MKRLVFVLAALLVVALIPTRAQEKIETAVNWKIRQEGTDRSQVMRTMHMLTDVHGPRLTGSPNYKAACDWAVTQLTAWGLENAHLEPWSFGHPGWINERASAFALAPFKDTLVIEVVAWTPGTNGTVTGQVYQLVPPEKATKDQLAAYLAANADKVKGKVVLVGKQTVVPVTINPTAKRVEASELAARYDPNNPAPSPFGPPAGPPATPPQGPQPVSGREADEIIDQFLVANGAIVRVNDAGRPHGQIRAFNNRTFDLAKAVPSVIMRNEDYGRISRILADGTPVELEFNIVNQAFPETTSYNVVAEIPGTGRKDEFVMLGGHLDSWHAGTGATDDGTGVAIMMEAARILTTLGVKPLRTIRVALWSAEEQGLLGSQAYVKEHLGTFEEQKPGYAKFNGYVNVDSGTGRIRGGSVFGPPAAGTMLREILAPFADLGVVGAINSKRRTLGGTDSTSFNAAGLPGIGLNQDPIEYGTHTWHTNLDTYERLIEDDLKQAAIVAAATVYHLAMRDQPIPRFAKEEMPAPPKPEAR